MAETYNDPSPHRATRFIKQRVQDIEPTLDSDEEDSSSKRRRIKLKPAMMTSIVAGGVAGVVVDISLYPLDTIKTRLQSHLGFRKAGGFRGIYHGIAPLLLASAPTSALFFATYNTMVNTLRTEDSNKNPFVYLVAGSTAEIIGSSLRLPLEIIKQRNQISNKTSLYIIKNTYREEGIFGFYRGFWSTLLREIPFAAIQYPLWEYMLNELIIYQNGVELTALQTAICGAAAGAMAGALTTPMDVIKTRIMLAEKKKIDSYKKYLNYHIAKEVYFERGLRGLFAGLVPRVLWITLGGFIYFGAYEKTKLLVEKHGKKLKFWVKTPASHLASPSYPENYGGEETGVSEFVKSSEPYLVMNPDLENDDLKDIFKDNSEVKNPPQEQNIWDATLLPPV